MGKTVSPGWPSRNPISSPDSSWANSPAWSVVRPDYVSQVINTRAGVNFYEFINDFRVGEACRLLEFDPENRRNIADIAQDAGFSSINVFNSHFKRLRNTTPSAYRKQLVAADTAAQAPAD